MFDLKCISGIANAARGWFDSLRVRKADLDHREKDAVKAFYKAVNETRLYFSRLKAPKAAFLRNKYRGNRDTEEELSRLWTQASYSVAPFSKDLAKRCLIKGDYWAEPSVWSKCDVQENRIEIERMFADAMAIIQSD